MPADREFGTHVQELVWWSMLTHTDYLSMVFVREAKQRSSRQSVATYGTVSDLIAVVCEEDVLRSCRHGMPRSQCANH